jgi:hypothetical protein
LEKRGVHAGIVVTETFEPLGRFTVESVGSEGHPVVVLPQKTENEATPEQLREAADLVIRAIFGE